MNVKVIIANQDEVSDSTRIPLPLDDAFEDVESTLRLNPDTPLAILILPAHVSKDDAKDILDVLREYFQ